MERIECCSSIITMKIFETDRLTIRTLDEDDIDMKKIENEMSRISFVNQEQKRPNQEEKIPKSEEKVKKILKNTHKESKTIKKAKKKVKKSGHI